MLKGSNRYWDIDLPPLPLILLQASLYMDLTECLINYHGIFLNTAFNQEIQWTQTYILFYWSYFMSYHPDLSG